MLLIIPEHRPKVSEVTFTLFFEAQRTIYDETSKIFGNLHEVSSSLELKIEQERFLLWGWGARLLQPKDKDMLKEVDGSSDNWLQRSPKKFGDISRLLILIREELQDLVSVLETKEYKAWPVYVGVQELIDRLWEIQRRAESEGPDLRHLTEEMESMLEARMLTPDQKMLQMTWLQLDSNKSYTNIARLAAMMYMTKELGSDKQSNIGNLVFKDTKIDSHLERGVHRFGMFPKSENEDERVVLVEYMSYLSGEKEED